MADTLAELAKSMEDDLQQFALHLFNASWQQKQYATLTKMIQPKVVVSVLDFSENFTCVFQRERQSAHRCKQQITLHPIVSLYKCLLHLMTVRESLVFLSDDTRHDHHIVEHFIEKVSDYWQNTRHVQISQHIQWSDGCACQYKSKGPFADIAF